MDSNDRRDQQFDSQPSARFALALELMCGPESGLHVDRWVALVEAASDAGYAPASELWAVFEAMGVARPQSWERAFDLLARAASQGSASARRQLFVLARIDEADVPNVRADQGLAQVRDAISLPALLAHGERISLSNAPRIRSIERFATPAECAWLIERARSRLKPAKIINPDGDHMRDPGRTNSGTEFLVQDMDVVLEVVRSRISSATRIPVPVFEPTQILHYNVGEEFKPHFDFLDPTNPNHANLLDYGQRIATFLIYLNEEFEGGETQFPDIGLEFRGRTGDAIFWANLDMDGKPDALSRHAGMAPTTGNKWILSQWIRDRTPARR
jgi:hypothetical protein